MKQDTTYLRIADLPLAVEGPQATYILRNTAGFPAFIRPQQDEAPLFTFRYDETPPDLHRGKILHRFLSEEIECTFSSAGDGYYFSMRRKDGSLPFSWLYRPGDGIAQAGGDIDPTVLRFSLWLAFGLAALEHSSVAIHASTVVYDRRAVLFLGESGTGKSTHTRLWCEHIEGATLLNDDSPLLRVEKGQINAYGSPWSGKTHCYRDEHFPVAALVRLSQGSQNRIQRLTGAAAIGALLPSCPPSFSYAEKTSDQLLGLLSAILASVPVYHLECLPDPQAAQLALKTLFENKP